MRWFAEQKLRKFEEAKRYASPTAKEAIMLASRVA